MISKYTFRYTVCSTGVFFFSSAEYFKNKDLKFSQPDRNMVMLWWHCTKSHDRQVRVRGAPSN